MALVVALSGCGAAAAGPSPRRTLETLRAAAARGDADALYELLPERARRSESRAAFRGRVRAERRELADLATQITQAFEDARDPVAEIATGSSGGVAVLEGPDGWRLAQPGFGDGAAASWIDAARGLRLALARRSLSALLGVLSARARGALESEMAAIVAALADPAGLESSATPGPAQRVEVKLPDGRTLIVVREGASWRIDDVR